ncbi:hypothetical protein GCM10025785_10490 [Corynebacterium canis]
MDFGTFRIVWILFELDCGGLDCFGHIAALRATLILKNLLHGAGALGDDSAKKVIQGFL